MSPGGGRVTTARPEPSGRIAALGPAVTGTGVAASFALAVLVLVCAFTAVALPRASLGYRTESLQRIFRAAPAEQKTVLGDANLSGLDRAYLGPGQLARAGSNLAAG
ncbi:MAG: hypothetical protein ACTHPS_15790, partial [Streptosporangiaceae bacterium]